MEYIKRHAEAYDLSIAFQIEPIHGGMQNRSRFFYSLKNKFYPGKMSIVVIAMLPCLQDFLPP